MYVISNAHVYTLLALYKMSGRRFVVFVYPSPRCHNLAEVDTVVVPNMISPVLSFIFWESYRTGNGGDVSVLTVVHLHMIMHPT